MLNFDTRLFTVGKLASARLLVAFFYMSACVFVLGIEPCLVVSNNVTADFEEDQPKQGKCNTEYP